MDRSSPDPYTPYEVGLETLLSRLGSAHLRATEARVYQQRLGENIAQSRQYGDTETRQVERAAVLARLDRLARETLGVPFFELAGPAPGGDGSTYAAARDRYLAALRERYSFVETGAFAGLAQAGQEGRPRRLPLLGPGGVYVPLRFDAPTLYSIEPQQMDQELPGHDQEEERLQHLDEREPGPPSLAQVLALPGHLAIVGDAGCGKTTLLHVIISALAAGDPGAVAPELAPVLPRPAPLPIFLPLRLFERACGDDDRPGAYRRCAADLLHFVDEWFAQEYPWTRLPTTFLADRLGTGQAWLLLDGLDEVPNPAHRETMRNVIHELVVGLPGTRAVVTARVAAYRGARLGDLFTVVTVRDLDDGQQSRLVRAIYGGLALPEADRRAEALVERFRRSKALRELSRTPVMVWTAAAIHASRGELPTGRAALYEAYAGILLIKSAERAHYDAAAPDEPADEGGFPIAERLEHLSYAAFAVHGLLEGRPERRGKRNVVVGEEELAGEVLAPFLQKKHGLASREAHRLARDFLALMVERSGLLHETPEGYTIGGHLAMQAFLAGRYLADCYRRDEPEAYAAWLREKAVQSWWREVLLLAAGHLAEERGADAHHFLREIAAQGQTPTDQLTALALAARGLLQLRACPPLWYGELAANLANRLYQRLYARPTEVLAAVRQEAGLALGLLYGDPRGSLVDPHFAEPGGLPCFVLIPAGWFWMGDDKSAESNERPRHQVYLDAFELARYPTTNAMFARFVAAGGYGEARWWKEAVADGYWTESNGYRYGNRPRFWDEERLNDPAQPVVGVSWYEAVAYCRWLTAGMQDGYVYRLPTEAEWERVARSPLAGSGGGRRYPWGEGWQAGHCNSREVGLGAPSPVGIFPAGATEDGVEDMAGNVWEWCMDRYGEDYYRQSAGARNPAGPTQGEFRVLRGGSWYNVGPVACRCGCRDWLAPWSGVDVRGFRCARTFTP